MKKLLILLAVSTISYAGMSQETTPKQSSDTTTVTKHTLQDGAVMKDGKVKVWKNGSASVLNYGSLKLNNGATVYPDGTIKNSDSTSVVLTNGEYIDMDGNIGQLKKPKS